MGQEVCKKIFMQRPQIILNIDNEYMTFLLMDEMRRYYANSKVDMPQRHYLNRVVNYFKQWMFKYVDYAHYTVPLSTPTGDGFKFPGEYIGQYGAYEAVKHIYESNPAMSHLVNENSLYVSDRYF